MNGKANRKIWRRLALARPGSILAFGLAMVLSALAGNVLAQEMRIVKTDVQIDALDPGIRLFVREKMAEGNTRFTDDNVVLFLHGATAPSTCDFDLSYKDYSWADWMVKRGYVVYMGDYRNYGYSSREKAMDEPPAGNRPVTRSYLAVRDIQAMVNHIKARRGVNKVTLIGWSWGAMMAGYYASLRSEDVHKLVLFAPLYSYGQHTNLGPGSALQNKRRPSEFNFGLGAYRLASEAANTGRWNGEIPVQDKDEYRDPAVPAEFWKECMATDPTSATRNPPSLRAPNGVLEDSFYQATGRPLWNAANIYAPTLVIAGEFDTWSFPEDREGLMRDLTHAPAKKSVLIPNATHFVLFEKPRFQFFEKISEISKGVNPMRRREFITLLGGAAVAWPLAARAQQPAKVPRIGYLSPGSASAGQFARDDAFRQGLRELGLVEGKNIVIEYRFAEGKFDRLADLAAELVQLKVEVIVAVVTQASLAARDATMTIPIVMVGVSDPLGSGLIASHARPGANITGTSSMTAEVVGKSLELLKEAVPNVSLVAVLWNPGNAVFQAQMLRETEVAAGTLRVQFQTFGVRGPDEFDRAFAAIARERAGALLVLGDPILVLHQKRIADFAETSRLPAMAGWREYAAAGGLMAYGPNYAEGYRRAATYVDKILKGAKPADLPVEQPTMFELVINLRTAKALGLTFPLPLLGRADEVIE